MNIQLGKAGITSDEEVQRKVRIALATVTTGAKLTVQNWLEMGVVEARIRQIAQMGVGNLHITIEDQKAVKVPREHLEQFKALNPGVVCEPYDYTKEEPKALETQINTVVEDITAEVKPATTVGKKGKNK